MRTKLTAAAAAIALALPGATLAQSGVTVGGFLKLGVENIKIGGATRAGNDGEVRVADNSSRLIFGFSEQFGGGLAAIAQLDMRFTPDSGAGPSAQGNTWVGLKTDGWGSLTIGRWDLHWDQHASDMSGKASGLKATSSSLMDFVNVATAPGAATTQAIANGMRTPNVIRWESPSWSGFALIAAYSTSPTTASESDLASTVRNGYGWNINPKFEAGSWGLGYSYWSAKPDASLADQIGNNAYAYYKFSGFKIGLAYNRSELKSALGADAAKRNAWSIPLSWTSGPHNVYAHYTRADKDKVQDGLGIGDTGAAMAAVAYVYDLSKRTSLGVTYAQIRNEANAAYQFYGDNGGANSSANAAPLAGEDPRLLALVIKQAF